MIKKYIYVGAVVLVALLLCRAVDSSITAAPVRKDALQNLQAAYNIATWGVFSTRSGHIRPEPDNFREPLAPFVTSLLVRVYQQSGSGRALVDFSDGALCRSIKRINVLWAFVLLAGCAASAAVLMRSAAAAVLSMCLVYACFLRNPEHIDTLCTEIPAAALLVWASVLLTAGMHVRSLLLFFSAGLLLGLLALTKAVFLYLAAPVIVITAVYCRAGSAMSGLRMLLVALVLVAGFSAAAGPWMIRNYIYFDSPGIALRGGAVLYGRAVRNSMTAQEIIAALYLWGPGVYQRLVKNTFLDMSPEDYKKGGRAARLNRRADSGFYHSDLEALRSGRPWDTVSFHVRSRAEFVRMQNYFAWQGHSDPLHAADEYLKQAAIRMITEQPLRHVIVSIPFAWRGVWCFYGGGIFTLLNALCYAVFMVMAAWGLLTGRPRLTGFLLLPLCMLLFNALCTHSLMRYSAPAISHMIISLFMMIHMLTDRSNT